MKSGLLAVTDLYTVYGAKGPWSGARPSRPGAKRGFIENDNLSFIIFAAPPKSPKLLPLQQMITLHVQKRVLTTY